MDHPASKTKLSSGTSLYAGQPIQALLSINTSFHWGPGTYEEKKEKTYRMRFDVEELIDDWLVSGQKRGDFSAKVRTVVTCSPKSPLNLELGRWNFHRANHSCSSPPWRTIPAKSFSCSSPHHRRGDHGLRRAAWLRDIPRTRCSQGLGVTKRGSKYLRLRDGQQRMRQVIPNHGINSTA
jgi:hypothetical protein